MEEYRVILKVYLLRFGKHPKRFERAVRRQHGFELRDTAHDALDRSGRFERRQEAPLVLGDASAVRPLRFDADEQRDGAADHVGRHDDGHPADEVRRPVRHAGADFAAVACARLAVVLRDGVDAALIAEQPRAELGRAEQQRAQEGGFGDGFDYGGGH